MSVILAQSGGRSASSHPEEHKACQLDENMDIRGFELAGWHK